MEGNAAIVVVGIFAVVVILALILRSRTKATIKGPGGLELKLEASSDPKKSPGGIQMTDVKAGRDVAAHDRAGGGVSMNRVEAGQDVHATTKEQRPKK